MDDQHTKQALDDLADLFLTGIESAAPAARRPAPPPSPLDAPAPIRLRPKLVASEQNQTPTDPRQDRQMLDAVTGSHRADAPAVLESPFLRLAETESEPSVAPPAIENQKPASATGRNSEIEHLKPAPPVMVEAVLLGNLPGVSGPWLEQYAQALADQDGSVAVLHVGGDRIDVELVESKDAVGRLRPVIEMGLEDDRRAALVALLDSLVRAEAHPVTTILVHVEPAVDGTESLRLFALDDWTLLCGADDASVVAAYRMLKQRAEVDVTVSDKRIGLMVMGADEAQSRAAAARISATADSFLNAPVELVGWQKQMIPVHTRQVATFDHLTPLWPRLCDWFATLPTPQVDRVAAPPEAPPESAPESARRGHLEPAAAPAQPPPKAQQPPRRSAVMDLPAPPTQRRVEPPRPAAAAVPAPRHEPAPPPPSVAVPQPVVHSTPSAPAPQSGQPQARPSTLDTRHSTLETPLPALARLVETLPGSVALEARCPHLPAAEIVLDQSGVLHLLHRQTGELDQAVTQLLTVRQWVAEHRRLLALTQRQLRLDDAAAPVLHLLTDQSRQATPLVARLGDQLKLHLLRQVTVGQATTWVCAPLN